MLKSEILQKMIIISDGNIHDINHFLKVYSYAHMIGVLEGLDERTLDMLDISAIVHDISCPLCREKYQSTSGKYQEKESEDLLREFFRDINIDSDMLERIIYLISHHHTYENVDGIDYQILLEADYLVNADESDLKTDAIKAFCENVFKTDSGIRLLKSVYKL